MDDRRHRFPPALPVRGGRPRYTNRAAAGPLPRRPWVTSSARSSERGWRKLCEAQNADGRQRHSPLPPSC
ncbi:Hypothetical protein A7982_11235 [Minicystis rosea]|nr:Hypothetical protein A7982_11235 [Minicystis rosea]